MFTFQEFKKILKCSQHQMTREGIPSRPSSDKICNSCNSLFFMEKGDGRGGSLEILSTKPLETELESAKFLLLITG